MDGGMQGWRDGGMNRRTDPFLQLQESTVCCLRNTYTVECWDHQRRHEFCRFGARPGNAAVIRSPGLMVSAKFEFEG